MKVGFVGVGFMGRHMARNVLNGGHEMSVFDANREAAEELLSLGATWAKSPREAAEGCEVTFTSLPTPQVVEEVASGRGRNPEWGGARECSVRPQYHRPQYHSAHRRAR